MKASELRIGNLVDIMGDAMQVNGIDNEKQVIDIIRNDGSIFREVFLWATNPIPLTEEWLLRFGFKKDKRGNYKSPIKGDKRKSVSFEYYIFAPYWRIIMNHNPPCQYVHQLQNLYFALTGKELELSNGVQVPEGAEI